MDAVKFIEERDRMCKLRNGCDGCPAYSDVGSCKLSVTTGCKADDQVGIVADWSVAHPRKTRQTVFLEQWPDAEVKYGVVNIRPCTINAKKYRDAEGNCARRKGTTCAQCCREFWNQEVE